MFSGIVIVKIPWSSNRKLGGFHAGRYQVDQQERR
jgi:hypothetical protein